MRVLSPFYIPLLHLLLSSTLIDRIDGQVDVSTSFTCGDPEEAYFLDLEIFDSIEPYVQSSSKCNDDKGPYVPGTINWHVYALDDSDALPKISMYPEGLVKPYVKSSTLKFSFNKDLFSYKKGDRVTAGVNVYVPANQLQKINVEGINQVVELVNDATYPLQVRESGIDNEIYVNSPNSQVSFKTSGIDSFARIESNSGSSVEAAGIDNEVEIKTTNDATLTVDMQGVDNRVFIEGSHKEISMSGVDGSVSVSNNGTSTTCGNVDKSGIDNKCSVVSDQTVTIEELACVVESKVSKVWDCDWLEGLATAAIVGSVVVLVVICCCCVLGCYGIYRCTKYNNRRDTAVAAKNQPPGATQAVGGSVTVAASKPQEQPIQAAPASLQKQQPSLGDPEAGLPIVSAAALPGEHQPTDTNPPMVQAHVIDKKEEAVAAGTLIKAETGV